MTTTTTTTPEEDYEFRSSVGRRWKRCRYCNQEMIFFDPDIRNPANGKLIPQDVFGNHRCKGKERIVRF